MHLSLDIDIAYARDRQRRLQADRPADARAAVIPARVRIAFGARRARHLSPTALARRRAGELLPG